MTPSHHPDPDELLSYAAGMSPDWVSLVVACHLTYCQACRDEIAMLEDLGGALLGELAPGAGAPAPRPPADDVLRKAQAKQDRSPPHSKPAPAMIPRPLHAYFADEPRYRFLAPGVQHIPLSFSVGGVPARIVRFRPGFTVPEHAHGGLEMVLVLDGELTDGATEEVFSTGDLSRREQGTVHSQHITGKDPCVCLVVSEAPIVPSTLWGKLLKALAGV